MDLQKLWISCKRNLYWGKLWKGPSKLQTRTSRNHLLFSAEAARRNTDTCNTCQASLKNSNEGLVLTEKSVLCLASPTSQLKLPVNQTDGSDIWHYAHDSTLHASLNILSPLVSNLLAEIGDCALTFFSIACSALPSKGNRNPRTFKAALISYLFSTHLCQGSWTIQISTPCLENHFLTHGSSLQVEKISLTKPCFAVLHKHSFLLIKRRVCVERKPFCRKESAIVIV